jgi:hypothetical protein
MSYKLGWIAASWRAHARRAAAALAVAIYAVTPSKADIVYNVNLTFAPQGSAIGTITRCSTTSPNLFGTHFGAAFARSENDAA